MCVGEEGSGGNYRLLYMHVCDNVDAVYKLTRGRRNNACSRTGIINIFTAILC